MENNLNIPQNWNKVSFEIGCKLLEIDEMSGITEDEHFKLSASCFDVDVETLSITERKEFKEKLYTLLSKSIPTEFNNEFIIGGNRYLLEKDLDKMNWALFRDKNILLERNENNFWKTASLIVAALIRPAKKKKSKNPFKNIFSKPEFKIKEYDFGTLEGRAELLKKALSTSDLYGICLFFYLIVNVYLKTIFHFSSNGGQDIPTNTQKNLEENMDGKNTRLT